jgi:hypothetical protein
MVNPGSRMVLTILIREESQNTDIPRGRSMTGLTPAPDSPPSALFAYNTVAASVGTSDDLDCDYTTHRSLNRTSQPPDTEQRELEGPHQHNPDRPSSWSSQIDLICKAIAAPRDYPYAAQIQTVDDQIALHRAQTLFLQNVIRAVELLISSSSLRKEVSQ